MCSVKKNICTDINTAATPKPTKDQKMSKDNIRITKKEMFWAWLLLFIFSNIIFIMPHRILFFIKSIVKIPCSLDIFSSNERKNNQLNWTNDPSLSPSRGFFTYEFLKHIIKSFKKSQLTLLKATTKQY